MHKRVIPLILLSLIAADAFAQRTPATLGSGEKSLPALIEFPELKGDTSVTLRCAAIVEPKGNMEMNGCYAENPADQLFIQEIVDAADDARMQPALADGKAQTVYFQYRVQFVKKGGEQTVRVYPNPGVQENIDAYGEEHVAAQRVVGKEKWQEECPKNAAYLVWLKAHVAHNGTMSNPSLTHGGGLNPTPRCRQAILDTASSSLFFPALADGEAVPSTYVEPFGN